MVRTLSKIRRLKKKKSLYRHKVFWIMIFLASFVTTIGYFLLFSSVIQIQAITIRGIEGELKEQVLSQTESLVQKKIGFWNTKSVMLAESGRIQKEVLSLFPEIESVQVKRKLRDGLEVNVQQRIGVAVWCSDSCFALDVHGVIFRKKDSQALDFVLRDSKDAVSLGEQVVPVNLLSSVLSFRKDTEGLSGLKDANVRVASVFFASETASHWKTSEGWEIILNPKGDMAWQFTKLQAVLEKKISSQQRPKLDYIDLRFGDQAYIKYR